MNARYVAIWLPSYGMKKESLKRQREVIATEKGRVIFL